MKLGLAAFFLCLVWGAATAALAQDGNVEDIVRALMPKTGGAVPGSRSLRGLTIEEPADTQPPSINIRIGFAYNSAVLDADALVVLRRLGTALTDERLKSYNFKIAGYTDATGSEAYNLDLSNQRAGVVKAVLETMFDIPASRLVSVGYGETGLYDPGKPTDPINRRVQIVNEGPTQSQ